MCLMLLHYCFCLQASGGLVNSIYLSVAKEVEGVVCSLCVYICNWIYIFKIGRKYCTWQGVQ